MRTPDEIKKGLECCTQTAALCPDKECPYYANSEACMRAAPADALALIQRLEEQCKHMNDLRDATAERALKMEERVHQLEAERDAAVADLEHVKDCDSCKYDDACFTGKKDCFGCHEKRCPCLTCQYEWRGVQKEDGNAKSP